jgi:hypothetical protein
MPVRLAIVRQRPAFVVGDAELHAENRAPLLRLDIEALRESVGIYRSGLRRLADRDGRGIAFDLVRIRDI